MARSKRFELLTPRFVVWCSIQLSYERASGENRDGGGTYSISPGYARALTGLVLSPTTLGFYSQMKLASGPARP